jgi:hypothetical protein
MMVAQMPRTGRGPIPISYLISAIHTEQAGTEGQILRLIRSMDRDRFRPTLIVLQDTAWTKQFDDPRVPLETLGFHSLQRPADWLVISALARRLKQDQTQIVELHTADAHFVGAIAAHLAKVPVVISCRRNLGHKLGFKQKKHLRLLAKDGMLCNSDDYA